jgi:hypothetical protein
MSEGQAKVMTTIYKMEATDPKAAAAWIDSLPASDLAGDAAVHLAKVWAQTDPTSAAAYTVDLAPGDVQNQAVIAVVKAWTYIDP